MGSAIAKKAVAAIVTASAFSEGEPSHGTCSFAGATPPTPPRTVAPPNGKPHCGQLEAARDTMALHSGQGTSDMRAESYHASAGVLRGGGLLEVDEGHAVDGGRRPAAPRRRARARRRVVRGRRRLGRRQRRQLE